MVVYVCVLGGDGGCHYHNYSNFVVVVVVVVVMKLIRID